jgi:nicotinate-nucleotide adenylyltransferase
MVRRAVAGNPNFAVSTIEIERPGISYSVDTVRHFAKKSAGRDSYFFIIGFDAFRDIASWKDYKEIFPLCHFVVTSRPGTGNGPYPLRRVPVAVRTAFCYSFRQKAYKHRSGTFLYVVRLTDIAISASDIRRRVNEGRSIRYLVPSEVEAYIEKHGIYQEPLEGR